MRFSSNVGRELRDKITGYMIAWDLSNADTVRIIVGRGIGMSAAETVIVNEKMANGAEAARQIFGERVDGKRPRLLGRASQPVINFRVPYRIAAEITRRCKTTGNNPSIVVREIVAAGIEVIEDELHQRGEPIPPPIKDIAPDPRGMLGHIYIARDDAGRIHLGWTDSDPRGRLVGVQLLGYIVGTQARLAEIEDEYAKRRRHDGSYTLTARQIAAILDV